MQVHQQQIRELLDRVRSRWQRLSACRATARAALAASGVLALALVLTFWTTRSPVALAALGVVATALATAALVWGLWPARRALSDVQVARFIEESEPSLDDRLASAVDLLAPGREADPSRLAGPMVADAARRASGVDPGAVVPREILRRSAFQAAAAVLLLASVVFFGRHTARQSVDALSLTLFPSRVTLEVRPGNARVQAGSSLTIEARLVGNRAPVVARLLRSEGVGAPAPSDPDAWTEMIGDASGTFRLPLESVSTSFRYRVVAGTVTSPVYDVTVAHAPRVTRIDVDYVYPPSFGLQPRTEEDGGDIYAPAGTDVRVRIHTDRDASVGQLKLGDGKSVALVPLDGRTLSGALRILEDGSYRIALADREGLGSPGETEYFIRMLEDQPPAVRVLRPARDRTVTRLEEVDIEAQAEDDFGIDRLDLVYAVRGGAEKVVPLDVPRRAASVTGRHTLCLEDLDVHPGDFVSYYVRARDVPRGKRSSETRSDIFFLEVKPFEQEFTLAQSQAMAAGGGGGRPLDDLVSAQKEIIVATWKLDRRALASNGARSEEDIRSVGRAEAELKTRVEETSSSFRASTMRDPRRGQLPGGRGRGAAPQPDAQRAGQTMPEEDAMTAASGAMGKAVASLDGLKTREALPSEMDALNHLLKADADVKKRQVTRQQAGRGSAGNRNNQDLSTLFDKELRKQQTNYETPTSTEQRDEATASTLDKIKELARRQDELLRRQQDLARGRERMTPEELKRELEKLTREQSELRQRAEDLARQMANQQNQSGQENQSGQQNESGQQSQTSQGQSGPGQSGQPGPQRQSAGGGGQKGQQMRDISEEMRGAASELRREDPGQASERGSRALEKLRELERQLQPSAPDERRRARGDLQLEARQLADAERQLQSELGRPGQTAKDSLRRLAGEQERMADRARRLQQGLSQQGAASAGDPKDSKARNVQQTVAEAARDFEQQRVGDRMQQSAAEMRAAAGQPDTGKASDADRDAAKTAAATGRDLARALDKLADTLARAEGPRDHELRKLSDQRARAQELRERIDDLTRQLTSSSSSSGPQRPRGDGGRAGRGQSAGGAGAGELARLREDYNRQLQQTRELLDELRREDSGYARGGPGFTFEGQGMTLSAPGTEAFKQDFAKWEELRKQATQALERAESSLSKKLQAQESRDRLAAGVDDTPPAAYQQQVESYFKALATKAKP